MTSLFLCRFWQRNHQAIGVVKLGRVFLLLMCFWGQTAWAASTATTNVFHHAQAGDSFEVERWIRKGGNPSYIYHQKGEGMRHDKTFTPMHAALAWAGHKDDPVDVVRVLLKYNADIDYFADLNLKYATKDSFSIPPLYRAVSNDQVESARALIKAGAKTQYDYRDFEEPELDKSDPAWVFGTERAWRRRAVLATYVNSVAMTRMLFQEDVLSLAEVAGTLDERKDFVPQSGYSHLVEEYFQVLDGYTKKLSSLPEREQKLLNTMNKARFKLVGALMYVDDEKGCAMAEALLDEAGRKVDLGEVIAAKGSPVCYQYFKRQGASWPDSAKQLGVGPLHVAVKFNNHRLVEWLIEQDPSLLTSRDNEGRRPLLYSQNDAMVKFLLDHGATPPEAWKK
ncbi:ankyrin repeat domain-containing protein [Marinobacter sp.]|uniref:ankyrin repeat domain-containing protein n=1 Tax=Marinobacter sp. TaxID=50741 RepID=UPI002B266206|nr:ankyrin repeat domain-containing protein [Marinobacter sp.]